MSHASAFPVDRRASTFKLQPEHDIRNRHGAFGWLELVTKDPPAAARFHASLFGWDVSEIELAGGPYWVIKLGSHDIGGMRKPFPGEPDGDRWQVYVTVDDISKLPERIAAAGGTSTLPVTPLPGAGKFTGLASPGGAHLLAFEYERPFG